MKWIFFGVSAFMAAGAYATVLAINYGYRWTAACAAENGIRMETSDSRQVCVKQPVQLITIAARPW